MRFFALFVSCSVVLVLPSAARAAAVETADAARGVPPALYENGAYVTSLDGCLDFDPPARSTPQPPNTTLGLVNRMQTQRLADDFIIPAGQAWDLSRLRWRMYQPGVSPALQVDAAFVRLWTSDPRLGGEPLLGDLTTNRHDGTIPADAHRTGPADPQSCSRMIKNVELDLAWMPALPAGHYWLEVGLESSVGAGPFTPPTEPRNPNDNGLIIALSGAMTEALDDGSGLPLDFTFALTGDVVADPQRACVLPAGACQNATRADCTGALSGTWNYLHACAELGACCDFADGTCTDLAAPEACASATERFSVGVSCASIPSCGQVRGACCFADDQPVDCQSFVRGADCTAQGGYWHFGNCSTVACNDFCETLAVAVDGDQSFITEGATSGGPSTGPGCAYDPLVGGPDVWYRYTSTLVSTGGVIAVSTCVNDGYDATLQVYPITDAASCADLQDLLTDSLCDNDGCGTAQGPARLVVPSDPGDELWIRIGGYDGAAGSGQLTILPIENGLGACCLPNATCVITDAANCAASGGAHQPSHDCFNLVESCGPIGGCCADPNGCFTTTTAACAVADGVFLGAAVSCGLPDDCNADGQTDFCDLFLGAVDCNSNGVPDTCDIDPLTGGSADCNANQVPDECDDSALCCPGDASHDGVADDQDSELIAAALLAAQSACLDGDFCRLDANADLHLDGRDIAAFIERLVHQPQCEPLLHLSAAVLTPGGAGRDNQVFILDAAGDVIRQYPQIGSARTDNFGYRDGAGDGTHVYFGWVGGVARHDADGSGGVQIITGPVPGTNATWRALAFDPTGDGGSGSLWTQSFNSDLVETDLAGNLLNRFANNGSLLYGLAYDEATGRLWGHHQSAETASATVVEIDPETGLLTGVSFPSHFSVPGGSFEGLALHGGLSMDQASRTLFGVLQATHDALISVSTAGALVPPVSPNPRTDLETQLGSTTALGVAVVHP